MDRPLDEISGPQLSNFLVTGSRFPWFLTSGGHGFSGNPPKQLRVFYIGRHRLQFVYQTPTAFAKINISDWLSQIKSEAGFVQVAGVELTLLDCTRYFHKVTGINGLAQVVQNLGAKADPCKLARAPKVFENSAVRRLGYLLDRAGTVRQESQIDETAGPFRQAVDGITCRTVRKKCQMDA